VGLGEPVMLQLSLLINPASSFIEEESFVVKAYTSSTLTYLYDSLDENIFPARPCESPCKECEEDDNDVCTLCFTEEELDGTDYKDYYLDETEQTCLEACDDGYYPNALNTCKVCWENCKTCSAY